jgi:hypothetical protein
MAPSLDRFDALDDDALYRYLADRAATRDEYLVVEEHADGWVAETWNESGKASTRVAFSAQGRDRRTAMLGLARKLAP